MLEGTLFVVKERSEKCRPHSRDSPDSQQSLEQPTLSSVASHDHEFGVCRISFLLVKARSRRWVPRKQIPSISLHTYMILSLKILKAGSRTLQICSPQLLEVGM